MRIAASIGVLVATGFLSHSAGQATDYGSPNGSPDDNQPGGPGNNIPGNTDGSGNLPFPSNVVGTVPGSLPSSIGPISPGDGSSGFPPSGPTDGSSGLPPNGPGGIPGGVPGNPSGPLPGNSPGNAPPNVPGAGSIIVPSSFPTISPQNIPGSPGTPGSGSPGSGSPGSGFPGSPDSGASDIPTCPLRSTRTVVVTVYPTDTQDGSDFPWPDDSDSDGSEFPTPLPTNPAEITSLMPGSIIPPFTTLTLDIWGPDGSPSSSGTGTNDGTGSGDGNKPDDGNSPGNGSDNSNSNDGTDSGDGNSSDPNGENGSHNSPESPFSSPTPGSNGAPEYSDSASGGDSSVQFPGPSGVNTLAPIPSQSPGSPNNGGMQGNQPQFPSAGPAQEASDSLPVTTGPGPQGQGETSPSFTNAPGGNGAGQPSPSFITITGKDGLPTVVSSGDNAVPGQEQPPATPGSPPNGNSPGLPSGVPSGFPLPPSASTEIPGPQGPPNSQGGSLSGSEPAAGVTTCATFTITGTDGLPTILDSTWVVPLSTPSFEDSSQLPVTGVPQASLSGIPIDVGSIPTGPVPAPGSPQDGSESLSTTTCTSYTIIGTDGLPTVVHSTWAIPAATPGSGDSAGLPGSASGGFLTITGLSTFGPAGIPGASPTSSNLDSASPATTFTSFTVIGADGLPTVVGTTLVVPGPTNTDPSITFGSEGPSWASDALSNGATSAVTMQTTGAPGLPFPGSYGTAGSGDVGSEGITTCTSYTIIGTDGLPTVVDSTWVITGSTDTQSNMPSNPSFVSDSLPSGLPTGNPGSVTESPGLPSDGSQNNMPGLTTCITYTVIGTDGLPTIVDSTFVLPTDTGTPTGTSFVFPITTGDDQAGSSLEASEAFTTITTAVILGPDGNPTPTVQTIVFSDSSALGVSADVPQGVTSGIISPAGSGPVLTTGDLSPLSTGSLSLNGYDDGLPDWSMSVILTDASADAQATSDSGTTTGTFTWTVTSVVDPSNGPVSSDGAAQTPFTGNPSGNGASDLLPQTAYGPVASENTLWPLSAGTVTLQTSTWTNVIKEETTSYTINYPLTTLATITAPSKRLFHRGMSWSNSTTSVSSVVSSTVTESTSAASTPSICATGGSIGNTTIDFDNSKPGPLFNPVENIWFSGGFLIAPPTTQQPQPYTPSSGGQLVEFVPPALSNTTSTISGDVAQIGVGPHAASPCFRFDFFGASLGCDAHGDEKWCEFEISAYRWNETSSTEESIGWSETKQVPACPTFSKGGYELTRVDLDGYKDLSSVLITVRVSQNLRVWWGDDFRVGWTDNSCIAASCRTNVPSQFIKRETVISALRQGVYQWTPRELKRLEDGLV
ncbi:hypothetical protein F53441_1173 [Fusarium austroafricanum]|uniref:DUF7371 domain-containing protein n=1 Tax=Fusarium austroafricanum TaxID=2364996 RepID=A0A8H4PDL2_9HYPO|nr:hypothetical protein F53441_1173 [Fusarium austroafricanum]